MDVNLLLVPNMGSSCSHVVHENIKPLGKRRQHYQAVPLQVARCPSGSCEVTVSRVSMSVSAGLFYYSPSLIRKHFTFSDDEDTVAVSRASLNPGQPRQSACVSNALITEGVVGVCSSGLQSGLWVF